MLVCSVISLKGGVGKTSVVLGLAGAAQVKGMKTLVVDLDPQANATTAIDALNIKFTASDVLADARAGVLAQAIAKTGWGKGVDVLAAETTLEHRNHPIEGRAGEHRLRASMQGLKGYDLVLIDTPPSLGELTKNALAASQRALVVTQPTLFALNGAHQALAAVDVVRGGFNLRLATAGIIVNGYRTTSAEHRYRLQELRAAYGSLVLEPELPERTALVQSQGAHVPIQKWPTAAGRKLSQTFASYLDQLVLSAAEKGRSLTKGARR